jgi:hypothetical protein
MMDVYDLWEDHEAKQEAWRKRQPICSHCRREIQEERLFDIECEVYHLECAAELFCKFTEDYEWEED